MKTATSYRLTAEALKLIARMAKKLGLPRTAVIETAVREKAEKEGLR